MKLQQKLLIAPAAILALVAVLGAVIFDGMRSQREALVHIYKQESANYAAIAEIDLRQSEAYAQAYRILTWIGKYEGVKLLDA